MADYFDSGFCVREASWHGHENLLDDYPDDWDDARLAAGLMWEPVDVPLYAQVAPGKFRTVPEFKGIARDDTGEVLAVPSASYEVITHAQMGEIVEAIVDSETGVRFETAGSVKGGRQVWALARLDEPFTIPGDDTATYPYLALLNAHDGSAACKILYTMVRVVCWNTWQAASAEGDRSGAQYVFRHVGGVGERIEAAKEALSGLRAEAARYQTVCETLTKINVDDAMVRTFLSEFIPSPAEHGEQISDRVAKNIDAARGLFMGLVTDSPTTHTINESAYGLWMAATEYADHLRQYRTRDSYLGRQVLGRDRVKGRALSLVLDAAEVDDDVRADLVSLVPALGA